MKIDRLKNELGAWVKIEGPEHHIVMSSRVRLARNLTLRSFPGWAKKSERLKILEEIKPEVDVLPEMQSGFSENLQELTALEKQILVERHLISREHAAKGMGSAVVISRPQTLSIMINEEDHLRMQAIRSGLQLQEAFETINSVDTDLESRLEFAFDPRLGFLTACPSNVGTGMRGSAMLHLPALVLADQINQIIQSVNKLGFAVRGLYGEGTEAMGNLFQISNQTTLGEKEEEILERLTGIINTIIEHEENARAVLMEKKRNMLRDQIGRAYGVLSHAWAVASKEALNLLSLLRLGVDLEFFPLKFRQAIDELLMDTQPAHLQIGSDRRLSAEERDALRARSIRDRLKKAPPPDIVEPETDPEGSKDQEPPSSRRKKS